MYSIPLRILFFFFFCDEISIFLFISFSTTKDIKNSRFTSKIISNLPEKEKKRGEGGGGNAQYSAKSPFNNNFYFFIIAFPRFRWGRGKNFLKKSHFPEMENNISLSKKPCTISLPTHPSPLPPILSFLKISFYPLVFIPYPRNVTEKQISLFFFFFRGKIADDSDRDPRLARINIEDKITEQTFEHNTATRSLVDVIFQTILDFNRPPVNR